MEGFNIADAKAHFSDLVERAEAGEEIEIRRRGEPVAKIVPVRNRRKPLDIEALRALTSTLPFQEEGAGEFMRKMRDESRY